MSSELARLNNGLWVPVQPGRVHSRGSNITFGTGSHHTFYANKAIDPKLINRTCLICGQFTLVDFGPSGFFCATIKTGSGFAKTIQTFYSNREWTGGGSFPGGSKRSGYFLWQIMATPTASTISLEARIDMDGAGNITMWDAGDNQSNMYIFPVDY